MVELLPFRGIHYADQYAGPAVLSPPYDVIGEEGRQELLALEPHNAIRLTLGPVVDRQAWYQEAALTLGAWLDEGVLVRDAKPRLYGYRQAFTGPGGEFLVRSGFFARVRLQPWGQGIYRHEHTRVGPRQDRLNLFRAVRTNMSPVFGMYSDAAHELDACLEPPDDLFIDCGIAGVRETFWPIEGQAAQALLDGVGKRDVFIADGHHRYETALAYAQERREQDGNPDQVQPYDYVMMYLTPVEADGLVVLPTHRVVKAEGISAGELLTNLRKDFEVQRTCCCKQLTEQIGVSHVGEIKIGMILADAEYVLTLLDPARAVAAARNGESDVIARLDVSVLQNLILEPHLGITRDVLANGENVSYTIDEQEARKLVRKGDAAAAFILNPTSVQQILDAAHQDQTMPQKSTYFYPKLLTGLVFNPLDD